MRSIKRLNINNKGFSLVELIIAIAILAVVSGIILTFMNTSSNIFRRSSADVDIQTEAQMVANSISDLVIDCERTVREEKVSLADVPGVTDARTYDKSNSFVVLNDENKYYIFYDDKADKIFYLESIYNTSTKAWSPYVGSNAQLLAQNVTSFNYDLSELTTKKRLFSFNLDYTVGPKTFSGNYKVHMRNSIQSGTNFDVPPGGGTVTTVSVSPNPYVTWYHKPVGAQFFAKVRGTTIFVKTGVTWKIEESGSGFSVKEDTGEMTVGPSGSTGISIPKFRVVATSTDDNSKSGYAEVLIKRIINVRVQPTGGIVGEHEKYKLPATVRMGTVTCSAQVEGWNLVAEDSSVNWKLQYKADGSNEFKDLSYYNATTKSYTDTDKNMASLVPSKRTCTIKLGQNAGNGIVFRVTAVSAIDNITTGTYDFSVIATAKKFNDQFVRGAYINLIDYALVYGDNLQPTLSATNPRLKNASNLDTTSKSLIQIKDGILFWDYGVTAYGGPQGWDNYANSVNLEVDVDIVDYKGQASVATLNITFPGVGIYKKDSSLSNIVLSKGSSIDLPFNFTGYNFVDKNQLMLIADGDDLNAPGNASVNRYLDARITSQTGDRYDPVTDATIKVGLKTSDSRYPEDKIQFTIALRECYPLTNGNWQLPYNVYVANVKGRQVFVPGPDSSEWKSNVTTTYTTYNDYGPNKLKVDLKYVLNADGLDKVYYMKLDGIEYVYNSTLNYWQNK